MICCKKEEESECIVEINEIRIKLKYALFTYDSDEAGLNGSVDVYNTISTTNPKAFTLTNTIFNNIPDLILNQIPGSSGNRGSYFQLGRGLYEIDFELNCSKGTISYFDINTTTYVLSPSGSRFSSSSESNENYNHNKYIFNSTAPPGFFNYFAFSPASETILLLPLNSRYVIRLSIVKLF